MTPIDRRRFLEWTGIAPIGLATGCSSLPAGSARIDGKSADCWIEVSLDRIAWNLAQIRARVNNRPVMAVIKGNAYGHGLVEVGRFLEQQKVAGLAVGKVDEAIRLRDAGVRIPVLNLGPLLPDHATEIVQRDITQTIYTPEFIHLAKAAEKLGKPARVQVNIDTGLGRVGLSPFHARTYLDRVATTDGLQITGVFTALTEDPEFDVTQLRRLTLVCDAAETRGVRIPALHAASSAACLAMPKAHLDMVRPGIALYGHYPSDAEAKERKIDLRPAMQLKARVSCVKILQKGEAISYHRAFVAQKPTRVATLSIGYSDGYPHRAAKKAEVLIGGERRQAIALVTANHMTVDLGLRSTVAVGDEAVLFGEQGSQTLRATELAGWSDTSVYKILIESNPLLPRRFV